MRLSVEHFFVPHAPSSLGEQAMLHDIDPRLLIDRLHCRLAGLIPKEECKEMVDEIKAKVNDADWQNIFNTQWPSFAQGCDFERKVFGWKQFAFNHVFPFGAETEVLDEPCLKKESFPAVDREPDRDERQAVYTNLTDVQLARRPHHVDLPLLRRAVKDQG